MSTTLDKSQLCFACGRHHGSVTWELNCLKRELGKARAALEPIERLRREIRLLSPSWNEKLSKQKSEG
jgi:hypothetical protein